MIVLDQECAHRRIVRSEIDPGDRNLSDTAATQRQRSHTHQTRSPPGHANAEPPTILAGVVSTPGTQTVERRQRPSVLTLAFEGPPLSGIRFHLYRGG